MSYLRYLCLFGSSLPPVVCRKAIRLIYIICVCLVRLYLQLFVGRLYVLFTLFVFVCGEWCPPHIVLSFCFVFVRLVYHMFPVSLDCPTFIIPTLRGVP